jgi:hypothetical protein
LIDDGKLAANLILLQVLLVSSAKLKLDFHFLFEQPFRIRSLKVLFYLLIDFIEFLIINYSVEPDGISLIMSIKGSCNELDRQGSQVLIGLGGKGNHHVESPKTFDSPPLVHAFVGNSYSLVKFPEVDAQQSIRKLDSELKGERMARS